MDTLHNVMRSIDGERKAGQLAAPHRDHLTVFREFLDHLDRASRRRTARAKTAKGKPRRRR
jgi:hypothetical protein